MASTRTRARSQALLAAKVIVSAGLLAALIKWANPESLIERLIDVDLRLFAVAFAMLVAQVALSARKWQLILRADGHREPYFHLLRVYFVGGFLSLFLPTSFGGDAYRVAALKRRILLASGAASVLFDRLTGLGALCGIALAGILMFAETVWTVGAAVAALLIGAAGLFWAGNAAFIARVESMQGRVGLFAGRMLRSIRAYRSDWKMLARVLVISFVFQLNTVLVNYCYANALGLEIPLAALLLVVPLAYLTEVLPISIAGIGVREAVLVTLLVKLGYPPDYGVSLGLLIIVGRYLLGLLGGGLLLASIVSRHEPLRRPAR